MVHSPTAQRWFLLRVSHENITDRWQLEQQRAGLISELQTANRVKHLSGLIDAILAYSRAGRSRVERPFVDLEPLVGNTIDLLAPPPHVLIEISTSLPYLSLQAVRIQQVFQNLLSNAIDFLDKPEGRITVACTREAEHWHFTVADNGQGIEARHFERIFQLFQTLNSRDQRERTGVGLALVKKIVELEGGTLWVYSTPGEGATFHFTLPAASEATPTEFGALPARPLNNTSCSSRTTTSTL